MGRDCIADLVIFAFLTAKSGFKSLKDEHLHLSVIFFVIPCILQTSPTYTNNVRLTK